MPDRSSKRKRPVDVNQLAKSIVDDSTDEERPEEDPVHAAAVALGRKGGLKGGKVTQGKLTPEQRREKAKKAAAARWGQT